MGDEIGKKIKELRLAKGLTQAELAEIVSCKLYYNYKFFQK